MGETHSMRRVWRAMVKTYWRYAADDGDALAGYMAFSMFLSLFPFLIFVTALAALAIGPQDVDATLGYMFGLMPPDVAGVLAPVVAETTHARMGGALTLPLFGALWVASNGIEALRVALNRAYAQDEDRSWILRRLQSLLLVFAASVAFMLLTILIVLGPSLMAALDAVAPHTVVEIPYATALRYGLAALVLGVAIYAAHRILPSGHAEAPLWPGVVFTVLCWLAAGALFSVYLSYIPSYALTYGALGGVIVCLFFFYVSAAIVIFGAELNAVLGGLRRDPEGARRLAAQTPESGPEDETQGSQNAALHPR